MKPSVSIGLPSKAVTTSSRLDEWYSVGKNKATHKQAWCQISPIGRKTSIDNSGLSFGYFGAWQVSSKQGFQNGTSDRKQGSGSWMIIPFDSANYWWVSSVLFFLPVFNMRNNYIFLNLFGIFSLQDTRTKWLVADQNHSWYQYATDVSITFDNSNQLNAMVTSRGYYQPSRSIAI